MPSAIRVPCAKCGAPLPLSAFETRARCASCGAEQAIDPAVVRRIADHLRRVEADEGVTAIERAKLDPRQKKRRAIGAIVLAASFVGMFGAFGVSCVTCVFSRDANPDGQAFIYIFACVVGLGGAAIAAPLLRRTPIEGPAPMIEVRCGVCGAGVPVRAGAQVERCPFCEATLRADDATLASLERSAAAQSDDALADLERERR